MQEEQKNTPDIDPSGLFDTYKTKDGETLSSTVQEPIPPPIIPPEQTKHQESTMVTVIRIIIDGCVRMTKVAVWSIAVFGGLFITALATNTIDRAIHIINTNIGTDISLSGEVSIKKDVATDPEEQPITAGLASDTLTSPTSNTPDALASKRRAILEAKKAAKLLEEKQSALETTLH